MKALTKVVQCFIVCLMLTSVAVNTIAAEPEDSVDKILTIITSTQVTYSITTALVKGTNIEVINVPERGRRLSSQVDFFSRDQPKLQELFKRADAVVSIGKLWQDDALYTAVRKQNIRVVPIDATQPWSATLPGIAVVNRQDTRAPWEKENSAASKEPSYFFWHSTSNVIRSASIIASDLQALSPQYVDDIQNNLLSVNDRLRTIKNKYEALFSQIANVSVFLLADEFDYLTNEMGLFVEGYFLKQDIDWQEDDFNNLSRYLKESGITVVIHKWQPSDEIQQAIVEGGAQLVVLNTIDPGLVKSKKLQPQGYFQLLEENLEGLYLTFNK